MLRLERDAWSMIKWLRQSTNEYAPPPPPNLAVVACIGAGDVYLGRSGDHGLWQAGSGHRPARGMIQEMSLYAGWVVLVALESACEIACHRWEQRIVAVCEVAPVAAVVPVFPIGTYRHYTGTTVVSTMIPTFGPSQYARCVRRCCT